MDHTELRSAGVPAETPGLRGDLRAWLAENARRAGRRGSREEREPPCASRRVGSVSGKPSRVLHREVALGAERGEDRRQQSGRDAGPRSPLKEAAEVNPYNSDYFFWADVGAFRKEIEHYKEIEWPVNSKYFNDKITFFSHLGWDYNITNQQSYFTSQSRVIHGGYFIVPKDKIDYLKVKVDEVIEEILNDGYIGSDEKVFDLICKRDPDIFDLIKADWFEFYNMTL